MHSINVWKKTMDLDERKIIKNELIEEDLVSNKPVIRKLKSNGTDITIDGPKKITIDKDDNIFVLSEIEL